MRVSMTLLMAVRATDGIAAISDRKESYENRPPRSVKKHHTDKKGGFYISLAGDGGLAKGVPDGLDDARTGPADVVGRIRMIAAKRVAKTRRRYASVVGILIIADRNGLKMYNIDIDGRHVDVVENSGAVSVRGDGGARSLCEYITAKVGFSGTACETAARMMHVLASDVGEHVESMGGRSYGFDLVMLAPDGRARMLERCTAEFGRIDIRLRLEEPAPPAAHGGRAR